MSYTQLNARINDQTLELYNLPLLASGGVDEVQILCEFCELWDGYGKTAVFYRKGGPVYHIPLVENTVVVPWEVMTDAGVVFFGIMGVKENTRTTEVVRLIVEQGAISTATAEPKDPTPDIYQQILAEYTKLEVTQARIDEMVAARPGGGQHIYEFSDGVISCTITSNGAVAEISYALIGATVVLDAGKNHICEGLPDEFVPLYPVELSCDNSDLVVTLTQHNELSSDSDSVITHPIINIRNASNGISSIRLIGISGYGTFALAQMQIPELQDVRVGADGTTHDSAGTAVREQVRNIAVSEEQITAAVEAYLDENPIAPGATPEQMAQIQSNTESIGDIETALDRIIAIQSELIGGDVT